MMCVDHFVSPNIYVLVTKSFCSFLLFPLLSYVQGSTTGSNYGWLELVLIEAKDLVAADIRGTSDPYVRVQYGNLKKRTKVGNITIMLHIIVMIL